MWTACSDSTIVDIHQGWILFDEDGDGFHAGQDCDDLNADINPAATEICDGLDNDCDELIDDEDDNVDVGTGEVFYVDADEDGYGDLATPVQSCTLQPGAVENYDDLR